MAEKPAPPALSPAPLAPGHYIVATPIGNLRDITLRALDVLAGVDLVLVEDTRVSGKLLHAYGLKNKLERYDEYAAERARPKILQALAEGRRIALISDAGTPLISDPGYKLVVETVAAGHDLGGRVARAIEQDDLDVVILFPICQRDVDIDNHLICQRVDRGGTVEGKVTEATFDPRDDVAHFPSPMRPRATISRMISLVPSNILLILESRYARANGYSSLKP